MKSIDGHFMDFIILLSHFEKRWWNIGSLE